MRRKFLCIIFLGLIGMVFLNSCSTPTAPLIRDGNDLYVHPKLFEAINNYNPAQPVYFIDTSVNVQRNLANIFVRGVKKYKNYMRARGVGDKIIWPAQMTVNRDRTVSNVRPGIAIDTRPPRELRDAKLITPPWGSPLPDTTKRRISRGGAVRGVIPTEQVIWAVPVTDLSNAADRYAPTSRFRISWDGFEQVSYLRQFYIPRGGITQIYTFRDIPVPMGENSVVIDTMLGSNFTLVWDMGNEYQVLLVDPYMMDKPGILGRKGVDIREIVYYKLDTTVSRNGLAPIRQAVAGLPQDYIASDYEAYLGKEVVRDYVLHVTGGEVKRVIPAKTVKYKKYKTKTDPCSSEIKKLREVIKDLRNQVRTDYEENKQLNDKQRDKIRDSINKQKKP